MLEKFGLLVFISFCVLIIYFHGQAELEIYECAPRDNKSELYFLGTKRDFNILKSKVLYANEGDCLVQKMTRNDWIELKQVFRNTGGLR